MRRSEGHAERSTTASTGRTQDRIRPSRQHQQTPCNAGAIHTGHPRRTIQVLDKPRRRIHFARGAFGLDGK
jgi:hypothetical protein